MNVSKRRRRQLRQEGLLDQNNRLNPNKFSLIDVFKKYNITDRQSDVIASYEDGNNLVLHGLAGTGKTWLACYLAIDEVISGYSESRKVNIFRSVVPTRDMGFLPGSAKQKAQVYEEPYRVIFNDLFNRGDAYELLKTKNLVEFTSTSFLRGITIDNSIVIVDEINNMTFHELDSLITRVGKNTKIILCGDYRQSDLDRTERDGVKKFLGILNNIKGFDYYDFGVEDIVRSGLVKKYIIEKHKQGYV